MRPVKSDVRWHIIKRNCALGVFLIVLFWGIYVASLFGITFRGRGQRIVDALAGTRRSSTHGYELYGAIVVTVIASSLMAVWVRRAMLLARRGELLTGTVRRLGGINDVDSFRKIDFSYTYQGTAYSRKMWGGEKRERGEKIRLLVDPLKPGRVMFACDVLPEYEDEV